MEHTEQAESIFDGITYAKGASILRQLIFLLGSESFSKCLKKYFITYEWGNATLTDFMETLRPEFEAKCTFSFDAWMDSWI